MSASSATASSVAVLLLFKAKHHEGEGRSIREIWRVHVAACTRLRLVFLILIITGFWMVQHQLYATKPEYVLRIAGEGASPS